MFFVLGLKGMLLSLVLLLGVSFLLKSTPTRRRKERERETERELDFCFYRKILYVYIYINTFNILPTFFEQGKRFSCEFSLLKRKKERVREARGER
jgi:hypothetical protein